MTNPATRIHVPLTGPSKRSESLETETTVAEATAEDEDTHTDGDLPAADPNALAATAPDGQPSPEAAPSPRQDPQYQADRRLLRRLKRGDPRAFDEVVRTYQDRVFRLLYRMLGNRQEAEDVAQEVFIAVHRGIANYRGEGKLYTWIYRIASNTCKNRIKYLKGRNFHRSDDYEDNPRADLQAERAGPQLQSHVPGPEDVFVGNRLQRAIQRELEGLEADHRLLIVLRDVEGLSYQEMLEITGLQQGTLKSRLHRARLTLKARLAKELEA